MLTLSSLPATFFHLLRPLYCSFSTTGMAQHGCIPCSRYFADATALATHVTGKPHKRRLKTLQETPYTIEESRAAAGLGVDKGAYGRRKEEEKKSAMTVDKA